MGGGQDGIYSIPLLGALLKGTWDLGIFLPTHALHSRTALALVPSTSLPACRLQQGTAATHPFAHLSSQMTNHSFTAGLRAISQRGHDRFTPEEVKRTPSHPTQACYCSDPRFIRCYKNNWAVKISEPKCGGCFRREPSHGTIRSLFCMRK